MKLIPFKNVTRIHFLPHIVQARIVAVGNDGLRLPLEGIKVVDYLTTEERFPVHQGGLVDNGRGPFGFDAAS